MHRAEHNKELSKPILYVVCLLSQHNAVAITILHFLNFKVAYAKFDKLCERTCFVTYVHA